jgi:diacylglycerol kinase family enzyme
MLLLNYLRDRYWADKRLAGTKSQNPITFEHPYLIMNPKSGNGRAIKAKVDKLARERGIEVYVTKKGDNIEALSRKAAKNGADVLGVSGGDGTIGAVAKVAIEQNLPLVVLPGGTRCHFARDLGLDPDRIVDALEGFNGIERKIDAASINGRIFLNNASFGVYADIVDHDEYRDNKVATTRKVLQDLTNDKKKSYDLRFKDNRGKPHKKAVQLFIGVNPYEVMNLLELGHREKLDTGKLQVTALTKLDDKTIRSLAGVFTFKRNLKTNANVLQWTDTELTINSGSKKITAGVDGENESYKPPVKIKILPKALTLMVPAEGDRPRQKNPVSGTVLNRLWNSASGK